MWEHHMTSPNFSVDFKEVFERVVVQMDPKTYENPFLKK